MKRTLVWQSTEQWTILRENDNMFIIEAVYQSFEESYYKLSYNGKLVGYFGTVEAAGEAIEVFRVSLKNERDAA
jgi:hypothetical protein